MTVSSSEEDNFTADPVGHCCACAAVVVARGLLIDSVMTDNTAEYIVVFYIGDHGGFCPRAMAASAMQVASCVVCAVRLPLSREKLHIEPPLSFNCGGASVT